MLVDLVFTDANVPILRFRDYTRADLRELVAAFHDLASRADGETILPLAIEPEGIARVTLRVASRDQGARFTADRDAVVWECDEGGWAQIAELAGQVSPESSSFQWLDDHGEVLVLISPGGRW